MKRLFCISFVLLFTTIGIAQEETPATEAGEDFDLEGVLGVFEESEDLEDFEKKLNDQSNEINNLDLNKDEEVDIIKVVEYKEDNTHLLVLQAVLGEDDFQDIATIEIEKHAEDEISLQVIGDVDMYGPDYIVEPAKEEGSIAPYRLMAVFVSVHLWRPIRFIYHPGRAIFVSTVVWRPHPVWFRPWRPIARSTWIARNRRWHTARVMHTNRVHSVRARNMYASRRRTSAVAKSNFGPKPGPNLGPGPTPGPSRGPKKVGPNKKAVSQPARRRRQ